MRTGLLAVLAMPVLLTGCIGFIPVPSSSKQAEAGRVIQCEETRFIVPGHTRREQVVERLGSDFRCSPRAPVLAYAWELPGGTALWWWMVFCTEGGAADAGEWEWSHWRAFFVAYDKEGCVTQTKFVHLSSRKSLDEQMEAWARKP